LRMLYDEQLLEKKMDAAGRIGIKLTELALFMNSTFGVGLPATKTDQKALFMKLKKHGAIDVRIDGLSDEDAVLVIRPEILTLVVEENVRAAQAAFESARSGEAVDAGDASASADAAQSEDSPEAPKSARIISLDRVERSAHRP
jgi:hypothetical protein